MDNYHQSSSRAIASIAIADSPGWLKCAKDATATVQSVATIVALLIGAWWVLRRRRTRPRANFKHIVSHVPIDDDTYLVRVTVAIENVGDVVLRLEESVAVIRRVVPLHDQVRSALKARGTLEASEQSDLVWPIIDTRRRNWRGSEIESGESASFDFELFAPRTVRFVLVYSYFRNIKKPGDHGWNTSILFELKLSGTTDL
jgi:hypothetical protein